MATQFDTTEYSHKRLDGRIAGEEDVLRVWDTDNAPGRHYVFKFAEDRKLEFSHVELDTDETGWEVDDEAEIDVDMAKWIVRMGYADEIKDRHKTVVKIKVGRNYQD
jgi:hypothetical protein